MDLSDFDLEVFRTSRKRRAQGIKNVALAYAGLCFFGAVVDYYIGASFYLVAIFSLSSFLTVVLSFVTNEEHVEVMERALVVAVTIVVLAISFQENVVLCITFYVPTVLFLGFVERNSYWRKGLLLFVGICFVISYMQMPDDFLQDVNTRVIFIGFLDMSIMCVLIAVVIHYFSQLNYAAYSMAQNASNEAAARLLEAKNTNQRLQVQQGVYLSAQQRDTEAVELHRKQRSVLSARKEELEQFAYAASHDLKEPVRTIKSFIHVVRKRLPEGLEKELNLEEYFELVSVNTASMHMLLESLLSYSRTLGITLKPESVSVNRVIEKTLAKESEITFQIDSKEELNAHVDIGAFEKTIKIVASNAKKFVVKGERPMMNIEILESETANGQHDPPGVLLRFSDNGIGIPAEYHQRVFKLFQRLHKREEYNGAGIGLTLARRLLEKSNGSIWIESVEGGGTCVCIKLPSSSSCSELRTTS
ncbi:MAG: ATP-binding protein [Saprospiraceae bacterium]